MRIEAERGVDDPSLRLTPAPAFAHSDRSQKFTMGKQYNKSIKKKRRVAYLKRKKAAAKKTTKTAKK